MQWLLDLRCQLSIGLDCHEHFGGLYTDFEVVKVVAIEDVDIFHGRLDQGVRVGLGILAQQFLAQRPGVHADADRNAPVLTSGDHLFDFGLATDVARVNAQAVDAILGDFQCNFVVEVDVGDDGDTGSGADFTKRLSGVHTRHRDSD